MVGIIGGGPAGLFTAYKLGLRGITAKVYEEDKVIGKPIQCTGIVTKSIFKIIKPKKEVILNKLKRVVINSKWNNSVELKISDYVIDRSKFDQQIADMATKVGAEVYTKSKVKSIKRIKDRFVIHTKDSRAIVNKIVGADGPRSMVRKMINPSIKIRQYLGMQALVKGQFQKDTYQVYFGSMAPGFFAWVVPESENLARVGVASLKNPNAIFNKFLAKQGYKKIVKTQGGLIPIYNSKIKTQVNNIYLVGDAATQVKATTGGGIIQGMIAADSLAKSIHKGYDYEKTWKKKLHQELSLHLQIRKILNKFSDNDYKELFSLMDSKRIRSVLSKYSRDDIKKIIPLLILKEPRLLKFLTKLL